MISPENQPRRKVESRLPTNSGLFRMIVYQSDAGNQDIALIKGILTNGESVQVRIHTECLAGDAFGSKLCECGPRLEESLDYIKESQRGIVIYLRDREGRGIVQESSTLCLPPEERHYQRATEILDDLGVKREE